MVRRPGALEPLSHDGLDKVGLVKGIVGLAATRIRIHGVDNPPKERRKGGLGIVPAKDARGNAALLLQVGRLGVGQVLNSAGQIIVAEKTAHERPDHFLRRIQEPIAGHDRVVQELKRPAHEHIQVEVQIGGAGIRLLEVRRKGVAGLHALQDRGRLRIQADRHTLEKIVNLPRAPHKGVGRLVHDEHDLVVGTETAETLEKEMPNTEHFDVGIARDVQALDGKDVGKDDTVAHGVV